MLIKSNHNKFVRKIDTSIEQMVPSLKYCLNHHYRWRKLDENRDTGESSC